MSKIRVLGTGSYVPPEVLKNRDLHKMGLDTTDEWIVQRTGIRERRIADANVFTSDLAYEASLRALEMAGLSAADLDLIVLATITPDTCCPAGANWLQAKLKAEGAVGFDVTAACSGFVFGMNVAAQYLLSGACRRVLVVAAEIMTRTLNWRDKKTCILWGDGAGAVVLGIGEGSRLLLSTHLHTDGAGGKNLLLPGGGSRTTPISHESVDQQRHCLNMIEAAASFRTAVRRFVESIRESADFNHIPVEDIDWFVPHQANLRIFQAIANNLKISMDRFYVTIHKYGNISSASCAIAFDEAVRDGSVKAGDIVCMPVFGGGLTWGSAMFRW